METESVKVVLLGETGVGKSSLALRYVMNEFRPYSESTIGASFLSKTVEVQDEEEDLLEDEASSKSPKKKSAHSSKRTVSMKIWDTAGQEKYHSLAAMYYRGASAAIVVFDICNRGTFQTLKSWITEVRSNAPSHLVLVVCGNKSDLAQHRQVSEEEGREYAGRIDAFYIETSARDNNNVDDLFQEIAKRVPYVKESESISNAEDGVVNLGMEGPTSRRACCG